MQSHRIGLRCGNDHDVVDQLAQDLNGSVCGVVALPQGLVNLGHLLSVALGRLRMHSDAVGRRRNGQLGHQPFLLGLQLLQLPTQRLPVRVTVHHHVHHMLELALDRTQVARQVVPATATLVIKLVAFFPVSFDRRGNHIRVQQVVVERHHDPLLDMPGLHQAHVVAPP